MNVGRELSVVSVAGLELKNRCPLQPFSPLLSVSKLL
jgi:hypothetical protein